MPKNNIKKLRTKLDLTQKQLADAAGTSQQQIQRIESGIISAKLELAVSISNALNTPIDKVFIGYKAAASAANLRNLSKFEARYDEKSQKDFEKAGVDVDIYNWTYVVRLTNGKTFYYPVTSNTHERLFRLAQDYTHESFYVFYSEDKCVVLNPKFITYSKHMFEFEEIQDSEIPECTVYVYFNHDKDPVVFTAETFAEDDSDIDAELGYFQYIRDYAELGSNEDEPVFMFQDDGGEYVQLNPRHIALMEFPLEAVEYQYHLSKMEKYE